jgi:hypothetical protein
VSFDIFVQGFKNGEAAPGDGEAVMALLDPLIAQRDKGWARIEPEDGAAEVFGVDEPSSGLMFSHVEGRRAWDLIFEVARAAGFVVMPVGCGTLLPDEARRDDLPERVPQPVSLIGSGADLRAAVTGAPDPGRPVPLSRSV